MTREVPSTEWSKFFDELTREKLASQASVEVMNNETGAQILASNLPFGGITSEEKDGKSVIEIMLGNSPDNHQTHVISNPRKIYFRRENDTLRSIVEIEDESETKTLVFIG